MSNKLINVIKSHLEYFWKSTFSKFEHLRHLQKHLFGAKAPFLATLSSCELLSCWPNRGQMIENRVSKTPSLVIYYRFLIIYTEEKKGNTRVNNSVLDTLIANLWSNWELSRSWVESLNNYRLLLEPQQFSAASRTFAIVRKSNKTKSRASRQKVKLNKTRNKIEYFIGYNF